MKLRNLILSLTLTLFSGISAAGDKVGGGGDASEARVNEIRSDILSWIKEGGSKGLVLPAGATTADYDERMTEILQPKFVGITFVENDLSSDEELRVSVEGKPKTCRGYYSKKDSKPNIVCNISRFKGTTDSEQYRLIHHEYAGLAYLERNSGYASDYEISYQLTDYLVPTSVLRLAVKKATKPVEVLLYNFRVLDDRGDADRACSFSGKHLAIFFYADANIVIPTFQGDQAQATLPILEGSKKLVISFSDPYGIVPRSCTIVELTVNGVTTFHRLIPITQQRNDWTIKL